MGEPANADGLTPLVLRITAYQETPVPVVCALTRLPDDHRYTFVGAITIPLADAAGSSRCKAAKVRSPG